MRTCQLGPFKVTEKENRAIRLWAKREGLSLTAFVVRSCFQRIEAQKRIIELEGKEAAERYAQWRKEYGL